MTCPLRQERRILRLIGPNGHTTVFNCLTGFLKADGGSVEFSRSIYNWRPNNICALGVAERSGAGKGMTALENVMVSAYLRHMRRAAAQRRC